MVPVLLTWSVASTDQPRLVKLSATLTETVPFASVRTAGSEPTVTLARSIGGCP